MKKIINIILPSILTLAFLLGTASCSDDKRDDLDLSGGVKILNFKANGVDGIINDKAQTIDVYLPWSQDLKTLKAEMTLSGRAEVNPGLTGSVDLSKPVKYRVTNGNVYNDYSVVASYSKITSFSIGRYSGKINDETGSIIVKYPMGEDVTALVPEYTVTPGATVSPGLETAHDFTDPVTYTVSYMGESFNYVVTVIPTSFQLVGFLGTASSPSGIENEDEKAAFEWFSENMPEYEYISFNDVKGGKELGDFAVLWWHTDGKTRSLSSDALEPAVVTSLREYYNNGGSFLFSSWAVQYVADLGIPKDNKPANNLWGEANDPFEAGDDWGICFTGKESHPIYEGLVKPAGVDNKVFLISKGAKVKGHNAIWNFEESWVDYKSAEAWNAANGGVCLGSFHWDDSGNNRAVIFEYPKEGTRGGVICIGSEAYDWHVEGANTYKGNIEKLTSNIFDYLGE